MEKVIGCYFFEYILTYNLKNNDQFVTFDDKPSIYR